MIDQPGSLLVSVPWDQTRTWESTQSLGSCFSVMLSIGIFDFSLDTEAGSLSTLMFFKTHGPCMCSCMCPFCTCGSGPWVLRGARRTVYD